MQSSPQSLDRFLQAQDAVFETACEELAVGAKRSHWIWFVFPQLRALGRSSTANYFGLTDVDEAIAYWQHPVLGPRLKRCTDLLLAVTGKTVHDILGSPDDIKLRSCMTLFEVAAPDEPAFGAVLQRYYDGQRDHLTVRLIAGGSPTSN